jgi:hypothetical protein
MTFFSSGAIDYIGTSHTFTGAVGLPTGSTINGVAIAAAPVDNPITTATGESGTGAVTCLTASCTNLSGTYSVVGGTFTTGNLLALVWPTTTTAYKCSVTSNGNAAYYGFGHSVATATGMTITNAVSVAGVTVTFDYACPRF